MQYPAAPTRARLRPLVADSPATIALRAAVRAGKDLVAHRVAACNQLRAHLAVAFPAAIGLFSELDSPVSLAFLARFGSQDRAAQLDEDVIAAWLKTLPARGKPARCGPPGCWPRSGTAGVELLIGHGGFLHRSDFAGFVHTATSITDGITAMATIDWDAAISALHAGQLPVCGSERCILQLAASIAAGTPASLRDTIPGLDNRNLHLVITAIRHAAGQRPPHR